MKPEFVKALVALQTELKDAPKDKTSAIPGRPRYSYSSLESVMNTCRIPMNRHGFAITQRVESIDSKEVLTSELFHECGESIKNHIPLILQKNDMQGLGSAITYARRYGLSSLLGIVTEEDDDGEQAIKPSYQGSRVSASASPEKKDQASEQHQSVSSHGSEAVFTPGASHSTFSEHQKNKPLTSAQMMFAQKIVASKPKEEVDAALAMVSAKSLLDLTNESFQIFLKTLKIETKKK